MKCRVELGGTVRASALHRLPLWRPHGALVPDSEKGGPFPSGAGTSGPRSLPRALAGSSVADPPRGAVSVTR